MVEALEHIVPVLLLQCVKFALFQNKNTHYDILKMIFRANKTRSRRKKGKSRFATPFPGSLLLDPGNEVGRCGLPWSPSISIKLYDFFSNTKLLTSLSLQRISVGTPGPISPGAQTEEGVMGYPRHNTAMERKHIVRNFKLHSNLRANSLRSAAGGHQSSHSPLPLSSRGWPEESLLAG